MTTAFRQNYRLNVTEDGILRKTIGVWENGDEFLQDTMHDICSQEISDAKSVDEAWMERLFSEGLQGHSIFFVNHGLGGLVWRASLFQSSIFLKPSMTSLHCLRPRQLAPFLPNVVDLIRLRVLWDMELKDLS